MEVLSSRILLRPADRAASRLFYRDVLGLAVSREFGRAEDPGVSFFLGQGFLEVSPRGAGVVRECPALWLQVRDVQREYQRLVEEGVRVTRPPRLEPWGLLEMWVEDPAGLPIVLVEVPEGHPLRHDQRSFAPRPA